MHPGSPESPLASVTAGMGLGMRLVNSTWEVEIAMGETYHGWERKRPFS